MVFLHPVVRTDLVAAEHIALVVAPEMAADVLVHFDRAERPAALEPVYRLVAVDALAEVIRPGEHVLRPRDAQAAVALDRDRLEILRSEDRTAAAARVDAQCVGDDSGNADLVFTGL